MGTDDWNPDRRRRKRAFHSGLPELKFPTEIPTDRREALTTLLGVGAAAIGVLAFVILIAVIAMIIKSCNG